MALKVGAARAGLIGLCPLLPLWSLELGSHTGFQERDCSWCGHSVGKTDLALACQRNDVGPQFPCKQKGGLSKVLPLPGTLWESGDMI